MQICSSKGPTVLGQAQSLTLTGRTSIMPSMTNSSKWWRKRSCASSICWRSFGFEPPGMGNLLGIFRHLFFGIFGNFWGTYWDSMVHEPIDIYWEYVGKWWEMSAPTPAAQQSKATASYSPIHWSQGTRTNLATWEGGGRVPGRREESSIRIDVWVGAGWNHQPCKNLIKLVQFNSPPVFFSGICLQHTIASRFSTRVLLSHC